MKRSIYYCYTPVEPYHGHTIHPFSTFSLLFLILFFPLLTSQLIILFLTFPLPFSFSSLHYYLFLYHFSSIPLSSFIFCFSYSPPLTINLQFSFHSIHNFSHIKCYFSLFPSLIFHTQKVISLSYFFHFRWIF